MDVELEGEYKRTSRAIPPQRPAGHSNLAIDFETELYGISNCTPQKDVIWYIYNSKEYNLVSFVDPLGILDVNTGKVIKDGGAIFASDYIWVIEPDGKETLLEDYALAEITSPNFSIEWFTSIDFLKQTCITQSVWRIRKANDSIEPWNDVRRRYAKEVDDIKSAFLKALEPRVKDVANRFNRKYPIIEFNEIYSKALEITSILLSGENRKHIEQSVTKYHIEPSKRAENRKYFRENSVHTLKSYKDDKPTIDLVSKNAEALKDIMFFAPRLDADTLTGLLQSDSYSSIISGSINRDSKRIYKPNVNQNLVEFIFGKKGHYIPLFTYLKNYFRNDIKQHEKTRFDSSGEAFANADDVEFQKLFKDGNPEDGAEYWLKDDASFRPDMFRKRKWKSNVNNYSPEDTKKIKERVKNLLSKKKLLAYLSWLNNSYDSKDERARQNLKGAKEVLKNAGVGVPLPSSRHGG